MSKTEDQLQHKYLRVEWYMQYRLSDLEKARQVIKKMLKVELIELIRRIEEENDSTTC